MNFAGAALAGGFMFGPTGGLVGGIVGSIVGFLKADDYDGAVQAITKLNEDQKKTLMKRIGQILVAAGATASQLNSVEAFRDALLNFASQRSIREDLWNACLQSLQE